MLVYVNGVILLIVDSFDVLIDVGSLGMSRNRRTFVGFCSGKLLYVICSVIMEVPFFFSFISSSG